MATASRPGAVRVRRLAQGHRDTVLGGASDQTDNPFYRLSPSHLASALTAQTTPMSHPRV